MSSKILAAVLDTPMSPTEKLVMLVIADNVNNDGIGYPSASYLIEGTCLAERTIRAIIKQLSDADRPGGRLLTVEKRSRKNGSSAPNLITVEIDHLTWTGPRTSYFVDKRQQLQGGGASPAPLYLTKILY